MPATCSPLSLRTQRAWQTVQAIVWLVGFSIFCLLFIKPQVGLSLLWNVLIPIAPALLVFAPGLWRNICPLGVTSLAARHFGLSAQRQLPERSRVWLNLAGVVALFVIVLWRRLALDTNASATAMVLVGTALASVLMGLTFEWKSGWCSGLCPVYPVEKLYGSKPLMTFDNGHCDACQRCCNPCPDSTDAMHSMLGPRWNPQIVAEWLVVGAFPGFVWGWFHIPDYSAEATTWQTVFESLYMPALGMAVTLMLFAVLSSLYAKKHWLYLVRFFAAVTISCYYWYRIPALVGYGLFPEDDVLVNLSGRLPDWWVFIPRTLITGLFFWWFLLHRSPKRRWSQRPPVAESVSVARHNYRELPVLSRD